MANAKEEMSPNTKRALVAGGLLTAVGIGVGVAMAMSSPAAASTAPPKPGPGPGPIFPPPGVLTQWKPLTPTPSFVPNVPPAFALSAGQYRMSVDAPPTNLDPTSPEYLALVAFTQTIPAQQDNQLVTYDVAGGPALPADWSAADKALPNRVRSSFIIPAGSGIATIPQMYNLAIWALA